MTTKGSESEPLTTKDESRSCLSCCGLEHSEQEHLKYGRDYFWDNWKGVAMLLVFELHFMQLTWYTSKPEVYWDSLVGQAQLGFSGVCFLTAMPSFCFISGYMSTASPKRKQLINQLRHISAFFISHMLALAAGYHAHHQSSVNTFKHEHPHLNETNAELKAAGKPELKPPGFVPFPFYQIIGLDWYLWCVVLWRCFLPFLSLLHRPLAASFVIGFTMMWTDAFKSTYSNAPCAFLPFFMLGFLFKDFARDQQDRLNAWRESRTPRIGLLALVALIVAASVYTKARTHAYISHAAGCFWGGNTGLTITQFKPENYLKSHDDLRDAPLPLLPPESTFCQSPVGLLHVVLFYGFGSALILLTMSLVPTVELPILTKAGANSIYIYLTHMYFAAAPALGIMYGFVHFGIALNPWLGTALVCLFIFGLFACLAQPWLPLICGPCIEPKIETCCIAREKDEIP